MQDSSSRIYPLRVISDISLYINDSFGGHSLLSQAVPLSKSKLSFADAAAMPSPEPISHIVLCPHHIDAFQILYFIFGVDAGVIPQICLKNINGVLT